MYVTLGDGDPRIRHVHRKVFLPTYGLFDEERFVERGREVRAFDTPWGRAAMLVCEDAWHSMTATIAALDGAQIIFVCAAPPARGPWPKTDDVPGPASIEPVGSAHSRHRRRARRVSSRSRTSSAARAARSFPAVRSSPGPKGEVARPRAAVGGRDPVGDASISPTSRARAPTCRSSPTSRRWCRTCARASTTVDGRRADDVRVRSARRSIGASKRRQPTRPHAESSGRSCRWFAWRRRREPPPAPLDDRRRAHRAVARRISSATRWSAADSNAAVVGVSGGVDSAVTAYLAANALGPKNVLGVRMPYRTSSKESLDHAQLVIDALGIQSRTIDISAAVDGYLAQRAGRRAVDVAAT